MDNQRTARNAPSYGNLEDRSAGPGAGNPAAGGSPRAEPVGFRHAKPHISQEPIFDAVTTPSASAPSQPERCVAADAGGARHRHMGVATADPQYLPVTGAPARHERAADATRRSQDSGHRRVIHSDRYLQTPKAGRSIFTSREDRARRHVRKFFIVLIVAAFILALVWYFFIR